MITYDCGTFLFPNKQFLSHNLTICRDQRFFLIAVSWKSFHLFILFCFFWLFFFSKITVLKCK